MALRTTEYDEISISAGTWSTNGHNRNMNNIYLNGFSVDNKPSVTFGSGTVFYLVNRFTTVISTETIDFPTIATTQYQILYLKYDNTTKNTEFVLSDVVLNPGNGDTVYYFSIFVVNTVAGQAVTLENNIIWNCAVGPYLSKDENGYFNVFDESFYLTANNDANTANLYMRWDNKNQRLNLAHNPTNGAISLSGYDVNENIQLSTLFSPTGNIYTDKGTVLFNEDLATNSYLNNNFIVKDENGFYNLPDISTRFVTPRNLSGTFIKSVDSNDTDTTLFELQSLLSGEVNLVGIKHSDLSSNVLSLKEDGNLTTSLGSVTFNNQEIKTNVYTLYNGSAITNGNTQALAENLNEYNVLKFKVEYTGDTSTWDPPIQWITWTRSRNLTAGSVSVEDLASFGSNIHSTYTTSEFKTDLEIKLSDTTVTVDVCGIAEFEMLTVGQPITLKFRGGAGVTQVVGIKYTT